MSGRLLSFKDYIGGADNVQVIEMFPRNQKRYTYNFVSDVSAWDFTADYQTLVLDNVTYDRVTGDPNFADTNVIGYFDNQANITPATYINEDDAATGDIVFTIPQNRYTGPIKPNARTNVVMTVVSFQWQTNATPPVYDLHRWAIIERWEPGVTPGDPTLSANFVAMGVGSIATFTDDASTEAGRANAAGVYNVEGVTNASSEGTGQNFRVYISDTGATDVNITTRGRGFAVGDTIKILDTDIGSTGSSDITVTITGTA